MGLDARLRLNMRPIVLEEEEHEPVSRCYCGGWPHLNHIRDRVWISCSAPGCRMRSKVYDELELDYAIHDWNMEVEEMEKIWGKKK